MTPEIGSLRALANGESQFVGSSSGVYFINTVRRAFSTTDTPAAVDGHHKSGTDKESRDDPSPEDCIVGGDEGAERGLGGSPGNGSDRGPNQQSSNHSSPLFTDTGFMDDMKKLPEYSVARELVLTYFRIWHPLVPFLQGPECLAELDALYDPNRETRSTISLSHLVTFRCIFNIARLEKDSLHDISSTAIRSPSDLLPTLSLLALRSDTVSIQALLSAQVYFISTMSLRHASSVSGLISKSIFQSGMHRCPVRYDHLSPDERSMRKRIFWSFYVLDRFISQSLGHPNGIQDSDIDVCPPGHRDLHEPVSKSALQSGSADNAILHLPSNHPERLTASPEVQSHSRDSSPEIEEEEPNARTSTSPPVGDTSTTSTLSAAILRYRQETQAVLQKHVRHSQLVGRILEVFHKSIHARDMDNQTVLFLKADVSAFGNDLTLPRLNPMLLDTTELTPDPTVFPFIAYHYTTLLLNRPSLSLDSRCAEFRAALQACIGAANTIVQTIEQYAGLGGPLFWPGYMSAVWMSGLVLALAARLKAYNTAKAKLGIHSALKLLTTMEKRWTMARHCKEVLSVLLQRIEAASKSHKRDHFHATPTGEKRVGGSDREKNVIGTTQKPPKRRKTGVYASGSQPAAIGDYTSMSPRGNTTALDATRGSQPPWPNSLQKQMNNINSRTRDGWRDSLCNFDTTQPIPYSPQQLRTDSPYYVQLGQPDASQFASQSDPNFYNNMPSMGPYFAPIPTTFPDRNRNVPNQHMDQLDGVNNFFDMFDGATWGSLLDIVNGAGAGT